MLALYTLKESWKWHRAISLVIVTATVLGSWPVLLFLLSSLRPGFRSSWFSILFITTRRIWRRTWGARLRRSPPWMLQGQMRVGLEIESETTATIELHGYDQVIWRMTRIKWSCINFNSQLLDSTKSSHNFKDLIPVLTCINSMQSLQGIGATTQFKK